MSGLQSFKTKPCRRSVKPAKRFSDVRNTKWSVKEMRLLANGLEKYGFADVSKIAADIGTRSENEVRFFLQKWSNRVFKKNSGKNENPLYKLFSKQHVNEIKDFQCFPPIALWKKVVSHLKQPRFSKINHSNVFADLFRQFAKEEEPYVYEGYPNFKRIYEYLAYTLEGGIPPVTSAEDNLILCYLMLDLKQFIDKNHLSEEKEFFRNFVGPHQFVPSYDSNTMDKFDLDVIREYVNENVKSASSSNDVNVEEAGPSGTRRSQNRVNSSRAKGPCSLYTDGSSDEDDESTNTVQSQNEEKKALLNLLKKKKYPKDVDYIPKGDIVEVPAHLYHLYKLHQDIQESINPMIVPVWMQEAEQELIYDYYEKCEAPAGGSGGN